MFTPARFVKYNSCFKKKLLGEIITSINDVPGLNQAHTQTALRIDEACELTFAHFMQIRLKTILAH